MANTITTSTDLLTTLFADNTDGDISAQDMRNFIVSTVTPIVGTAGESLVLGNVVYPKSDGKYWKAKANSSTTLPCVAIVAQASISSSATGALLNIGYITNGAWNWNVNGLLYISDTTGGTMTQTAPTTSGSSVQIVGYAISATQIFFNPNYVFITLV
jgi:hypothetical protein